MRTIPLLVIFLFTLAITSPAQTNESGTLSQYLAQSKTLLQNGGKWRAFNKDYQSDDQMSPRYFEYEFLAGANANTLKMKVTAYIPKKSQWVTLWDGFYSWDGKKQKVVYFSVGADGSVATGEARIASEKEFTLTFTITKPDGDIKTYQHSRIFGGDGFIEAKGELRGGRDWVIQSSDTWVRQEQPKGVITFMSTRDGNFEVYSMKTNGDSVVNLTCNKASDYSFSYAPGRRLVFNSGREGNDDIFIMEADGKNVTNLTNHAASDRVANCSPDGSKIVFSSNRDGGTDLYIMNVDGSEVKRLTSNDNYEDAPTWSPDGKKVLFSRDVRAEKETSQNIPSNGEIFIMDADGSNEKRLTDRPGFDGGPQFSPDGTQIAFYGKTAEGNYEIFLMNADGSNVINLTEDELEDYSPSWSPDGKWIAYTKGSSANYDVWAIHIETRIKHRLTTQLKRDESPIWLSLK